MIIPKRCKCEATVGHGVGVEEMRLPSGSPFVMPTDLYRIICQHCHRATSWFYGVEEAVIAWNEKGSAR